MKSKTTYWISTSLVACAIGISGLLALVQAPFMMRALAHLGYPPYFSSFLGAAKLSGVCVLLLPGPMRLNLTRLKEWAYVGCAVTTLSGSYSHLRSGDGWMALEPLITFAALVVSYWSSPADRSFRLYPQRRASARLKRKDCFSLREYWSRSQPGKRSNPLDG